MTISNLIADSGYAASFQSLGQYRTALVQAARRFEQSVITPDKLKDIASAIVMAYKCGKLGHAYEPGYTEHEAVAWEIGNRESR